jgi:hypothetical protein
VTQLNAYAKGEQSLANMLVRLLAVLAMLRELRNFAPAWTLDQPD